MGEKCLKITQNPANGIQKQLQKKENTSDRISQKFVGKNIELVLQCRLSEQVRNDSENCLQPPVTQSGSYVKVPYKSSATKGKKQF